MKKSSILAASILLLAGVIARVPAYADSVLYSDLGSGGSIYSNYGAWTVAGSASGYGMSETNASLFTVVGSGSLSVSQIDLAVSNIFNSLDTFNASIWTDNAGLPGTQVTGAFWGLSTTTNYGTCCSLVTTTGITGVTLTGGQQYFMVLDPVSLSDASWNGWNLNNQGVSGLMVQNGFSVGTTYPLGAFDVLGDTSVPEPCPLLLILSGLVALFGVNEASRRGYFGRVLG
jgi:hypothetical protein